MNGDIALVKEQRNGKVRTRTRTIALLMCGWGVLTAADLMPFTSDGCSLFPDGTLKQRELWLVCCTEHDYAYWKGGTEAERIAADERLRECVAALGEPKIAKVMLSGVRAGGSPYLPTPFRWGYGWSYPRYYAPLSEEERAAVEAQADPKQ